MEPRHAAAHVEHFERHGWVLIERLLSETEIGEALPGLFELYPSVEQFHAGGDARSAPFQAEAASPANRGEDPRFRPLQFAGLKEFPFTDLALNRLPLHPAIIAVAEDLLRTRDGRFRQIQLFLFLSDVTAEHGPTRIVSRTLTDDTPLIDLAFPRARVSSERHAAWEAAAQSAVGPRGSLLVYSADVVHRGTEMRIERGGRFFFNLAYRVADAD